MKICIINGSPKGKYSITLQTMLYILKRNPTIEYTIIDAGTKIKYYETHFDEITQTISDATLIIFSYPVYTFVAPYQLHRFIELLKHSNIDLSGKFATQVTTSKHFYDITAHDYIKQNCQDLNMKFIQGMSADMEDLLNPKGQKDAIDFWNFVQFCINNNIYDKIEKTISLYKNYEPLNVKKAKITTKKIAIITNVEKNDSELQLMIDDFKDYLPYESYIVNINDFDFKGGCLGCLKCAVDGQCVYNDGFAEFLKQNIHSADALIYAFTIKDHSMGASFKIFDDRQFCNGHRTLTMGTPCAYIINGDYENEKNLQLIIKGRCQVGQNILSGIITDKESLQNTVAILQYALENSYIPQQNFLGVGGMKIFRDLIYISGGMLKADYKFYKKNHFFDDMPHKQKKNRLKMKLVGKLLSNKKLVAKMGNKMNEAMIAPYQKVIDDK